MTTTHGAVPGGVGADPAVALRRADGLQLLGQMEGSGYRVPPFMVRRSDGQFLHLTRLLYLVLEATDGLRTAGEVAAEVSAAYGRTVSPGNVDSLVSGKLRPLGLLTTADGRQPELKRSNPLLGLRFRVAVTDETWTRRLTQPFGVLFRSFVWLPVLVAFAVVCWWVFLEKGLASATYEAFEHPGLLVFVFVVTVLSAGFHEFGHAAAARYGGAVPGVMGAGVYLVWPAFYTDVTDSYRLDRRGRLRTDLGGLYFNAIVAVGITAAWWLSGYDALLLVVAAQIVQMLGQLLPLVRFDGYHVLADLTGVPDLFHRIKPTLLGILPWRWRDPEARVLKPWARAVVTLWVLTVVPVLAFVLVLLVLTLPRVVATAWAKLAVEQDRLAAAWGDGELLQSTARLLTILGVVLPVLAVVLMLGRVVHQVGRGVWRRTAERPGQRVLAIVTAAALVAGLIWAWWPDGRTYRPIQPDEQGTLVSALSDTSPRTRPPAQVSAGLAEGDRGEMVATWDAQEPMPTEAEPELALVLVPQVEDPALSPSEVEPGWVFPFSQPLAPGPGDNQALSVNTEDGTTEYDVAISLVWVTDGTPALNTNEAYAFASCSSCASVAVAFQVVVVVGDNDTAVPQNLAGAVNSDCVNCLTYALAQQLFLTLDEPLSAEAMAALDELWAQVAAFADDIGSHDVSELDNQLDAFVDQILAIIEADQPGTLGATDPTPTEGQPPTTDASTTGSTDESSTVPSPSPSETPVSPAPDESSTTAAPTTAEPSGTTEPGDAATP